MNSTVPHHEKQFSITLGIFTPTIALLWRPFGEGSIGGAVNNIKYANPMQYQSLQNTFLFSVV